MGTIRQRRTVTDGYLHGRAPEQLRAEPSAPSVLDRIDWTSDASRHTDDTGALTRDGFRRMVEVARIEYSVEHRVPWRGDEPT